MSFRLKHKHATTQTDTGSFLIREGGSKREGKWALRRRGGPE